MYTLCMYVCMHACMHVCRYVCMYISLCLATCQPSHKHSLSFIISSSITACYSLSLSLSVCICLYLSTFIIIYYYLSSSIISINQSLCINLSWSIIVCHGLSLSIMFFHCLSISIIAYHYLSLPIILYHYISIVLCRYVCTIICNYLPRCFIYHHRLSCVSAVFYPSAVFTYRTIAWLINFDLIIALACSSHLSWSISIHLHPSPSISIYPSIHLSIGASSKQYEQKPHLQAPQVIALPGEQSWELAIACNLQLQPGNWLCPLSGFAECKQLWQGAIVVVQECHLAAWTFQRKDIVNDLQPMLVQFELLTASVKDS